MAKWNCCELSSLCHAQTQKYFVFNACWTSLWLLELVHCLLQCLEQNCLKNVIPEFLNCPTYIFKNTDEIYFSIFHFFFGIVNVPIYWFVSYIPFEFRGRVGSFFSRQSFFIYFCQLFNDFSYFICSLFFDCKLAVL